jgi:D-arginine dehydrogenase
VKSAEIVVVGGGIAGLSAAWSLARAGHRVALFEREELLATHSSGRNAAIFRQLDASPGGVQLSLRSRAMLDALMASRGGWLRRTGQLFVARIESALETLVALARRDGIRHTLLDRRELERQVPTLCGGSACCALFAPDDGVMDIHGVCTALADECRAAKAELSTRAEVSRVLVAKDRVEGVLLSSGERVGASAVVLAAGAWASSLGQTADAPLSLSPLRRHVFQLDTPGLSPETPVVWCVDDEVYFRPESGGALASACDEEPFEPCLPPEAPHARELLAEKLSRLAPSLAESGVRRGWACLRTFAADRAMVIGADPRVAGLHWIAGLGGHGMAAGVAAGEQLALSMRGEKSSLTEPLSPARLLRHQ